MSQIINQPELSKQLVLKAKAGDTESISSLADMLFRKGNYEGALAWYKKAANENYADAQYMLGRMYNHGFGIPQDYHNAMVYFLRAYKNGKHTAGTNIGCLCYFGLGVEKDYEKAMTCFMKAAEYGDFNAEYYIGMLYEYGDGVKENVPLALEWYEKSARHGSKEAEVSKKRLLTQGYQLCKKEKNVELLKVKLGVAERDLIESENENQELDKKAEKLTNDMKNIEAMYLAYKEEEVKKIMDEFDACRLQIKYAKKIMNYAVGKDNDEDDE